MKTKTKTIYLSESGVKALQMEGGVNNSAYTLEYAYADYARFKHKVDLEIPDKGREVLLTEEAFDDAMDKKIAEEMSWENFKFLVKTKLFGTIK
jgi:hypothetical protein